MAVTKRYGHGVSAGIVDQVIVSFWGEILSEFTDETAVIFHRSIIGDNELSLNNSRKLKLYFELSSI